MPKLDSDPQDSPCGFFIARDSSTISPVHVPSLSELNSIVNSCMKEFNVIP